MTVTIELKPETEKRLAERAQRENLKLETFLEVFIEENLNGEGESAAEEKEKLGAKTETTEEWLERFHRWLDSHKNENYPVLSDEAYSRENIY